jgi:hypothetical protein
MIGESGASWNNVNVSMIYCIFIWKLKLWTKQLKLLDHITEKYVNLFLWYLKQEVLWRTTAYFHLVRHRKHSKQRVQQFFYCCMCIGSSGKVLPSLCLPRIGDISHADWWEGFMKYAVETGSGPLHTKFYKDCFRHSKFKREGYTDTQTALWSHKPTLIFFKIRRVGLKYVLL